MSGMLGVVHWNLRFGADTHYFDRHLDLSDFDNMPRDQLQALIGDAGARVTCTFELADKDYGNGFSAHCTVSLTCNQEGRDVEEAAELASGLAARFTAEALETAAGIYKAYRSTQQPAGRRT